MAAVFLVQPVGWKELDLRLKYPNGPDVVGCLHSLSRGVWCGCGVGNIPRCYSNTSGVYGMNSKADGWKALGEIFFKYFDY